MPTSRTRKSKRRAKIAARARRRERAAAYPSWFDPSIRNVLRQRRTLLFAKRPRELEQATAALLGEQLHRVCNTHTAAPHFDSWFTELVTTVVACASDPAAQTDPDQQSTWWLLHGLLAIAPVGFLIDPVQDLLDATTGHCEPPWLPLTCRVQATGDIQRLSITDGTRTGFIAGYEYPGGADRHVYLFDLAVTNPNEGLQQGISNFTAWPDQYAAEPAELLRADAFDTVEAATQAWRASVGPAATNSQPTALTDPSDLAFLPYCCDPTAVPGTESRNRLDNWFRAARRIEELIITLRRRGTPLPPLPGLHPELIGI
ncbi:hypothetical protein ACFVUS_38415 [Nocardia sp. NPDC058058]|uniref:hypothetical protein n=1 Tax=Nocardia sp. NPDC058058 TaxID=3346317 RepID=UPI0036DE619B